MNTPDIEDRASDAAKAAESLAVASELEDRADRGMFESSLDLGEIAANVDERKALRRKVDKVEFGLALHDLAEGVRGLIRVTPFTAVLAGVALGMAVGARRRGRRAPAKRA